jgi:hypothetical protein
MSVQHDTKPAENLTQEEMTLIEFPIGLISDRLPNDPQTGKEVTKISFEQWIRLPSGERVKQEWNVVSPEEPGLPRGADLSVLFLLLQIWCEQGFQNKQVRFGSIYQLLQRMGMPDDAQYYKRVRKSLERWLAVSFFTQYAVWNPKKRSYIPKLHFNVISRIQYDQEMEIEELGLCDDTGFVEFTDALLFLVRNGHFKTTDAAFYWGLDTPLRRRMFQLLDKRKVQGKTQVQRFDLFSFAKKLGTHDVTLSRYKPKDLRKSWGPHLIYFRDEKHYLEGFGFPKDGRRTYLEVAYTGDFLEPLSEREQQLVNEIVRTFDEESSRRYYERVIAELGSDEVASIFDMVKGAWEAGRTKNPGAVMVSLLQPKRREREAREDRAKIIASCTLCDEKGVLLLQSHRGRTVLHQCPHDSEAVRALEMVKGLTRI